MNNYLLLIKHEDKVVCRKRKKISNAE